MSPEPDQDIRPALGAALAAEPEYDYPEDWQEQGWCCRECGVAAWNTMSAQLRAEFGKPAS